MKPIVSKVSVLSSCFLLFLVLQRVDANHQPKQGIVTEEDDGVLRGRVVAGASHGTAASASSTSNDALSLTNRGKDSNRKLTGKGEGKGCSGDDYDAYHVSR